MSVKIDRISLERGDTLSIHCENSREHMIYIQVTEDDKFLISGPNNCNLLTFEITRKGIRKVRKPKAPGLKIEGIKKKVKKQTESLTRSRKIRGKTVYENWGL